MGKDEVDWVCYGNENGTLQLAQLTDSTYRVVFENNAGKIFDTTAFVRSFFGGIEYEEEPFLQIGTGGLVREKDGVFVHDFTGIATMLLCTEIRAIYTRKFYRLNEQIRLVGRLKGAKDGKTIQGVYIPPMQIRIGDYFEALGKIKREKYIVWNGLSADKGGGVDLDTAQVGYRLVFEADVELNKLEVK